MVAVTEATWRALNKTLREQERVITRAQALSLGLSPSQIRHRIRPDGGPWQCLVPGVYLAATGTPTQRQLEIAALRRAGPGSALTGIAALRHHGLRVPERGPYTVLVPASQCRRSHGFVRVWPTTRMPEFVMADGAVRFTRAARAVADASRELGSLREVRAVTADAVQRNCCQLADLTEELAQAPRRQSSWLRQALEEVADGVRSVAEGDLRDLIIRAGLPRPMFNARLFAGDRFLGAVDAWWPDAGVAAEVDSREWHLSPEDWERTLARHTRMGAYGIVVQHFPPRRIHTEPEQVVAAIRSALAAGRGRPAPDVLARPAA
jgi:hypothetical protein